MEEDKYYFDYKTERIGKGNPYRRCIHCKKSVPEINGKLENHASWCEYRIEKEKELNIKIE
jgi:hypothetical protein